jgi:N-glycosylase/DNA lyase
MYYPRPSDPLAEANDVLLRVSGRLKLPAPISASAANGRVIEVRLTGDACARLAPRDLICAYEAISGIPCALLDATAEVGGVIVRFALIDFIGDVERAMRGVGPVVAERLASFEKTKGSEDALFSELCFCILTANYTAVGGMRIQQLIGDGFLRLPEAELAERLRSLGHRFPSSRAGYIVGARRLYGRLGALLERFPAASEAREWLVENIKGLGYKEASHFLRNTGHTDVAIIDRHILRFLKARGLIGDVPGSLTKRRYLCYELRLRAVARRLGVSLGELDLYLWYMATGKVLK